MRKMKLINFFLIPLFLISGCQKKDEISLRLDEEEKDELDTSHLEGAPLSNPQEILISENE